MARLATDRPASETAPPMRQALSFALLGAVQVTLIATITVITVALPAIQRELDLDEADLVFATAAYSLSFGGLLVLGGRLADLLGHRRIFLTGAVLFAAASLAAAGAANLWMLVGARFGQGVGAALAAPAAMALLGSVYPDPERRGKALAVWGVLASIGASSGNILSGVILNWASWRWVFVAPAVLTAAVALVAPRVLPHGPEPRRERLDLLGAVLITTGLSALIFGVGELDLAWIAVGAVLLATFAISQTRARNPLVPPSFLASPRRMAALLSIGTTAAAMAAFFFILALYFQQVQGYSALLTSAAFVPPVLAVVFTASVGGRAVRRLGAEATTAGGLALGGAGLALLALIEADSPYVGVLLAGTALFPVGAGFAFSGATVWAVEGASPQQAGLAGGVVNTAMEIGPPIGLASLVTLAAFHSGSLHHLPTPQATTSGYALAFGAAGMALLLTAALALTQRPRSDQNEKTPNDRSSS